MKKWAEIEYSSSAHHVENSEPGYHDTVFKDFIHIAWSSLAHPYMMCSITVCEIFVNGNGFPQEFDIGTQFIFID